MPALPIPHGIADAVMAALRRHTIETAHPPSTLLLSPFEWADLRSSPIVATIGQLFAPGGTLRVDGVAVRKDPWIPAGLAATMDPPRMHRLRCTDHEDCNESRELGYACAAREADRIGEGRVGEVPR